MPLLINKPKGFTSFDVIAVVRKKLSVRKVGHAGTLDPMATGLLIVLVGRDETKKQDKFMAADKEYIAEITLGKISSTYDGEGELQASGDLRKISLNDINTVLKTFEGELQQRPPIHSAIKIKGQRLYKLARQGKIDPTDVPLRQVVIHSIELLEYNLPTIKIKVHCGKGTYIRSLANDIGESLGTGAYLSALQRTRIGDCYLENAIELSELTLKASADELTTQQ